MSESTIRLAYSRPEGTATVEASPFGATSTTQSEYDEKCEFIDRLFRRYRRPLRNYLNKLTRSPDETEDVIQETYLRLVRTDKLDRLEAKARNYVFAIATNLVRDRRRYDRAHSRDRHVSIDDTELPCDRPMPEQVVERERLLATIKRCVLGLPPRCQRVFLLHAVERLTFKEIAAALQISSKTAERDFTLALELCQLGLKDRSK
jgi:RNA polymerase sigma-70 factor (ECF subfamily)